MPVRTAGFKKGAGPACWLRGLGRRRIGALDRWGCSKGWCIVVQARHGDRAKVQREGVESGGSFKARECSVLRGRGAWGLAPVVRSGQTDSCSAKAENSSQLCGGPGHGLRRAVNGKEMAGPPQAALHAWVMRAPGRALLAPQGVWPQRGRALQRVRVGRASVLGFASPGVRGSLSRPCRGRAGSRGGSRWGVRLMFRTAPVRSGHRRGIGGVPQRVGRSERR
jgi:hypothetical protein